MPGTGNKSVPRLEIISAILIAVVSFSTALVIYLTNNASSSANTNNHQGMITAMKLEAFSNENWRKTYQEASSAYSYTVAAAGIEIQKSSQDASVLSQMENFERYLLPNMKILGEPFSTDKSYSDPAGKINLQARFNTLQASPEIKELDPAIYFTHAEVFYAEQRWYLVSSILMAFSLFWLTISQISHNRRFLTLALGCSFFLAGIIWVVAHLLSTGGAG